MPRLSIVIPCLGGAAEFDGTLVSVLQNRPTDCEVLVVHTEPYDDPYALRNEVRFVESHAESLVELLNAALDDATGEVIHIVGCGLEVVEGWTVAAEKHFADPEVAAVSPVVLDRNGNVIAAGVRCTLGGDRRVVDDPRVISRGSGRLRAAILGPVLNAAYYRREVLVALGGFEAALGDELADAGIALAMQSLSRLHILEPASQLTRTTNIQGSVAPRLTAAKARERLYFRYAASHGGLGSLAVHALAVFGEAIREVPRNLVPLSLLGRVGAWFELGAMQPYQEQLQTASDRLAELAELRASVRKTARRGSSRPAPAAAPQRRAA